MSSGEPPRRRTDPGAGRDSCRRVDVYVRDDVPAALAHRVHDVLRRLARLSETGTIGTYRVEQWPPRVTVLDEDCPDDRSSRRALIARFEEWADRQGYSLGPAFRTRTVTVSMSGRNVRVERHSVPLVTLALYQGEELIGVVPCADGDRHCTVDACIETLESAGWATFPRPFRGNSTAETEGSGD